MINFIVFVEFSDIYYGVILFLLLIYNRKLLLINKSNRSKCLFLIITCKQLSKFSS